jgi:Rieske Fe-S protein
VTGFKLSKGQKKVAKKVKKYVKEGVGRKNPGKLDEDGKVVGDATGARKNEDGVDANDVMKDDEWEDIDDMQDTIAEPIMEPAKPPPAAPTADQMNVSTESSSSTDMSANTQGEVNAATTTSASGTQSSTTKKNPKWVKQPKLPKNQPQSIPDLVKDAESNTGDGKGHKLKVRLFRGP